MLIAFFIVYVVILVLFILGSPEAPTCSKCGRWKKPHVSQVPCGGCVVTYGCPNCESKEVR